MKLSAKAQAALDKVVKKFESGDLSPIVEMARTQLDPEAPAAKWSFSNRVLAYAQTKSLDCRGYRQWQAVDRQVQKGTGAAFIFGPILVKDKEDPEKRKLVGFRPIPVFGYHETDGGDNPLSYEPKELPPLVGVAEKMDIELRWSPMSGALGSCNVKGETVTIGAEHAAVFFHELAHACHARLDGSLKGGQDAGQETVAEFTAAVLSEMYGCPHDGNAWSYIKGYNSDPLRAMMKALGTVEKVLALIEENGE